MTTIFLRSVKGSPLSTAEVDSNFSNLNADKLEISEAVVSNTPNKVVKRDSAGNFSAGTITANLNGSLLGVPTAPTPLAGTNTTQIATTAFVIGERSNAAILTNKTITFGDNSISGTSAQLAAAISDETGSGPLVFADSPALTGTPTAPTAVAGTNNTQLATTSFVITALRAIYPIGSVYINAAVDTNPSVLLGFGTWVEIGAGRVLVGQNVSDSSFDSIGETGGIKDAIVVSHTHTFSGTTANNGSHTHTINDPSHSHTTTAASYSRGSYQYAPAELGHYPGWAPGTAVSSATTGISINSAGNHTHTLSGTTDSTGSSGANANLQPYVVVKMWQRTA